MRIKNTILLITTLIFFLVISYSSFGDNKRDDQPFILNANKIINKKEQSLIIAEGNVEIIQGNEVLRADFLKFDRICPNWTFVRMFFLCKVVKKCS